MLEINPFADALAHLLKHGSTPVRRVTLITFLAAPVIGAASAVLFGNVDPLQAVAVATAFAIVTSVLVFSSYQALLAKEKQEERVQRVEENLREHPEKPQLAWDLARVKLENYLDRNLSQVRSIYWLTLLVMLSGFGFVAYGLFQASVDPVKLPVSVVAAASGVIISFIGGSFLLIYRSILAQSKEYVTVLERINAVGMAVQVISTIPDESDQLKNLTRSELAKQLLNLYSKPAPSAPSGVA